MPSGNNGAASGSYIQRIWWHTEEPGIYIKYTGGTLEGKIVSLDADFGAGAISWRCTAPPPDASTNPGVPADDLPASCR